MGLDVTDDAVPQPDLAGAGKGLRFAVVCGRFNGHVTLRLLDGALRGFAACGVADDDVQVEWVPGAFELPLAAKTFAETGHYDAVMAVGCVIRGDTAALRVRRRPVPPRASSRPASTPACRASSAS